MRIAIVQSSYIPWKGYFDLIHSVDEFVLFDDVQYTRRDWRNRNRIKTPHGPAWLTIPVQQQGTLSRSPIKDIAVSDPDVGRRGTGGPSARATRRAPYFRTYADRSRAPLPRTAARRSLSAINRRWIDRPLRDPRHPHEAVVVDGLRARLTARPSGWSSICRQAGADVYVSGPAAAAYIDRSDLPGTRASSSSYFDYSGYPEYRAAVPAVRSLVSASSI